MVDYGAHAFELALCLAPPRSVKNVERAQNEGGLLLLAHCLLHIAIAIYCYYVCSSILLLLLLSIAPLLLLLLYYIWPPSILGPFDIC